MDNAVDEGLNAIHQYSEISSEEPSADNSAAPSQPGSPRLGIDHHLHGRQRGRVRFNSSSEVNDETNKRSSFPLRDSPVSTPTIQTPKQTKAGPAHSRNSSVTNLSRHVPENEMVSPFLDPPQSRESSPVRKPRPSVLRNNSSSFGDLDAVNEDVDQDDNEKIFSALAAQERAQRVASLVGSHSAPASRRTSFEDDVDKGYSPPRHTGQYPVRIDDIPLVDIGRRTYDAPDIDTDEDDFELKPQEREKETSSSEAHKLVRAHTRRARPTGLKMPNGPSSGLVSGQITPTAEQDPDDYVSRPQQYRGGVLSSLLKLYNTPHGRNGNGGESAGSPSQTATPGSSGTTTPNKKHAKWYKHKNHSTDTLSQLMEASRMLGSPAAGSAGSRPNSIRPSIGMRSHSSRLMDATRGKMNRPRLEDEIRITIHIAETLSRQKYLIRLCRALMSYGAPTHRLEEYMKMTARVLEIEGQFLYIPGCMIVSFDDAATHTTEVKIVRSIQGVDLGKLKDVHAIYKEVVHDVIGVEEATQRLDEIIKRHQRYNRWLLVIVYGFASASVGPFAFQARMVDLPIAFLLGSLLGILQLIIAPASDLYSNVFEISAAVLTSFLARAFGSIPNKTGGTIFCFSALAQSSIALILPGYMVLCGSLELQSRSMVAGSVRMVYAIIYSLFLGFGITIGTALYGLLDSNATSTTTCSNTMNEYYKFIFVPIFTLCLCIINQAKWKQTPAMVLISMAGYSVNFFSSKRFPSNAQISNTLGALVIGVMGNLYSRVRHGLAAAALLPAIFVQVPSGLAASGSLLAGLSSADQITNSTTYANGTAKVTINGTSSVSANGDLNSIVLNVGYSMVQVAIGITVGLFLSALIVYPLGKRRSGLFSF